MHEKVDVVFSAVELGQGGPEVLACFPHDPFAGGEHGLIEDLAAVFGTKTK